MLLLGDELIRDAGIAVFELVKNAYDADATDCSVVLRNIHTDSAQASIEISDNGTGMDYRTVTKVWANPGTRNRLNQRDQSDYKDQRSKRFHRLPLGAKGVGRFAVHKLGFRTEMVTRARGDDEVYVVVDWKAFDSDVPLEDISVQVIRRDPEVFTGRKTGTRIIVTELRDMPWTRRRARMLHRSLTSICSPVNGPDQFSANLKLEPDPDRWLAGMLTPQQAMEQAIFHFAGTLDKGELRYTYEFAPPAGMKDVDPRLASDITVALPRVADESSESPTDDQRFDIGPVHLDLSIFDRDRKTLKLLQGDSGSLTEFLDSNGGIRVYRDGVRVFDFGEPGNDWLELGGRRTNVPAKRIGNNQVIGTVSLDLESSNDLREKTNREGFIENAAYQEFRRRVMFAVQQAEAERNKDKRRVRKASSEPDQKEPVLGDLAQMREELKEIELKADDRTRLVRYVDQIEGQFKELLDRLMTAAGAGLNLSIVLHEIEKQIQTLGDVLNDGADAHEIIPLAKQLADMVNSLTWLTRQSGKTQVEASSFVDQCLFAWQFRFDRHSVSVVNGFEREDPDFSVRCNRRLVFSCLMNVVDNAIYWLSTRATPRKLYIGSTYEYSGAPAILVADNGPGFFDPPEYLTAPFYTRKPDGMGLGLHLTDEVMSSQKGRLVFPERGDVTVPRGYNGAILLLEFEGTS